VPARRQPTKGHALARARDEILLERFVTASSLLGPRSDHALRRLRSHLAPGRHRREAADPQHVAAGTTRRSAVSQSGGGQFGVYEYGTILRQRCAVRRRGCTYAADFDRQYASASPAALADEGSLPGDHPSAGASGAVDRDSPHPQARGNHPGAT